MKVSINKFLENPNDNVDDNYNFYDWFCSNLKLQSRMMTLVPKLKFLVKEGIIDGDNDYVWFKNNCPVEGSLYDDIRISSLNGDNYKGGFCPKSGHHIDMKCSVWMIDKNNDFKEIEFKNWASFKKEIKTDSNLKNQLKIHFNS